MCRDPAAMDDAVDRAHREVRGQMIAVGGFRSRRRVFGVDGVGDGSALIVVVVVVCCCYNTPSNLTASSRPERRDFGGGFSEAFC